MTRSIKKLLILFFLVSIFYSSYSKEFIITDLGAKGDGKTNSTKAVQEAIDNCSKEGGTVVFPAGTFLTGTIYLKSNVHILLKPASVWSAVNDLNLFPHIKVAKLSRMDIVPWRAFIYAANEENISITGSGTISPGGSYDIFQTHKGNDPNRPYGLHIVKCKNILISGIKMINSAFWMQRYLCCDNLKIIGIEVFNHCNLNNDGLDIDGCHNVVVSDCVIDSEDDALCMKAESERSCKDIVINNCILSSFASGFKMGTGSNGGFQRISATNCIIRPSLAKENHHEFGLWGGIAGIDLGNVDGGIMRNISISNFIIDSVETPLFIKLGERLDCSWQQNPDFTPGITSDIKISNIIATGSGKITSSITGYPGHKVENISLTNIQINSRGNATIDDTGIEVKESSGGYPVNRMFASNLPAHGLYIRHAKNIELSQIKLNLENDDERSAIVLDDVENLILKDYSADLNSSSQPLFLVNNSKNIEIDGDNSITDIKHFIKVLGEQSSEIKLKNNYLIDAKETTSPINLSVIPDNKINSIVKLNWDINNTNDVGLFQYIIYRNGKELARTRNLSYTDVDIEEDVEYNYQISCINGYNIESEKLSKKVKTLKDNAEAILEKVYVEDGETLKLYFNEPIDSESAMSLSNYSLDKGNIKQAKISDCKRVVYLIVDQLKKGEKYLFSYQNIKDLSKRGNPIKKQTLEIIDSPVLASWSFNKGSGEIAEDLSGNGNNGNIMNAQWVDGKISKALHFNGDSYIDCGNSKSLNLSGNFAVSVWLKLDDPEAGSYYRILSKRKIWNSDHGYELEINPAGKRLNISGGATDGALQGIAKYHFDKNWHHLVAMIKNNKAYFYIDGELVGTDSKVANPDVNDIPLFIGSNPKGKDNFEGALDELTIYKRALSLNEIKSLYLRK